jgi:DNA-binding beta-propeller fold protein YncE
MNPHTFPFVLSFETTAASLSGSLDFHRQAVKRSVRIMNAPRRIARVALLCLFSFALSRLTAAQATEGTQPVSTPGAGHIVHSKFGGQIFGFDIDQNGAEGVLSESQDLNNGNVLAAVETFDQKTGKILKVLVKTETQDDFLTNGIVGNSVGLVEHEHEISFLHVKRTFHTINPLDSNKFTSRWTPPLKKDDLIAKVSRSQGVPNVAVLAFENGGDEHTFIFSSNVAANTFGPFITLTDSHFSFFTSPQMAYDSKNNRAVLAAFDGVFTPPLMGLVNLVSGKITEFTGVGLGTPNGLAVDSTTGMACTTTLDDNSVEFYNLKTHTGFAETLPGANQSGEFGTEVAGDPVHHLFFVAQPTSSTQSGSSAIYVYDEKGNLKETLNGFHFQDRFKVIPTHIALNPSHRTGFVDGPDDPVTDIQSFTY